MGEDARDNLPRGVTENNFLERIETEELENIQQKHQDQNIQEWVVMV